MIEIDHRLTRLPWQRLPAVTIAHRTLVDFAVYADNSLVGLPRLPKRDQCTDCGGEIFAAHQQVVSQDLVVKIQSKDCVFHVYDFPYIVKISKRYNAIR